MVPGAYGSSNKLSKGKPIVDQILLPDVFKPLQINTLLWGKSSLAVLSGLQWQRPVWQVVLTKAC